MEGSLLPLSLLAPGKKALVRGITGGRGMRQKLAAMGFSPGLSVRVLQNNCRGPLIVSLGNTRVALGRGLAQKITVEEIP